MDSRVLRLMLEKGFSHHLSACCAVSDHGKCGFLPNPFFIVYLVLIYLYICMCIYIYICMYIYLYLYIYRYMDIYHALKYSFFAIRYYGLT